jgi:Coenzyme PQQ synthesis protein D (PqqD)
MTNDANEKYIRRAEHLAARMLGGEMMIMSLRDSTLFSLNETASAIWQAADGATALREIVERAIVPRFEVDPDTAYRDAVELVNGLAQHGILKVTDEPAGCRQADDRLESLSHGKS